MMVEKEMVIKEKKNEYTVTVTMHIKSESVEQAKSTAESKLVNVLNEWFIEDKCIDGGGFPIGSLLLWNIKAQTRIVSPIKIGEPSFVFDETQYGEEELMRMRKDEDIDYILVHRTLTNFTQDFGGFRLFYVVWSENRKSKDRFWGHYFEREDEAVKYWNGLLR